MERDSFGWTDVHEIAWRLADKFPDVEPLSVRFTDLHRWVTELTGFADDPRRSDEKVLEAIQMAWLEERAD
jgi:FeS assembly protein IscX